MMRFSTSLARRSRRGRACTAIRPQRSLRECTLAPETRTPACPTCERCGVQRHTGRTPTCSTSERCLRGAAMRRRALLTFWFLGWHSCSLILLRLPFVVDRASARIKAQPAHGQATSCDPSHPRKGVHLLNPRGQSVEVALGGEVPRRYGYDQPTDLPTKPSRCILASKTDGMPSSRRRV